MTVEEFAKWMAFYSICPFGSNWEDKRAAHQTLLIMARFGGKLPDNEDIYSPKKPEWTSKRERRSGQTAQEQRNLLRHFAMQMQAFNKAKGIKTPES